MLYIHFYPICINFWTVASCKWHEQILYVVSAMIIITYVILWYSMHISFVFIIFLGKVEEADEDTRGLKGPGLIWDPSSLKPGIFPLRPKSSMGSENAKYLRPTMLEWNPGLGWRMTFHF